MIAEHLSNILKLFLPSWNFFNDFAAVPRLDVRHLEAGHVHDWRPVLTENSTRRLARVLFNPNGNLALLQQSFIDRAATWLEAHPDASPLRFEQSRHHRTLSMIARDACPDSSSDKQFQYRLVLAEPGSPDQILFESKPHSLAEERR